MLYDAIMAERKIKQGLSIFFIQSVSFLIVILVITAAFGLFFFATAKRHLEDEVGKKLQDIAKIAAKNAPFERLDLIKVGDDQTRMVLRLKQKLGEIREATAVQNIFIFRPDHRSLLDLQPDRKIGYTYSPASFDSSFFSTLKQGHAVSTGSYHKADGSLYISAYAPVTDPEGQLFAVVGVDAGTREVEVIEKMQTRAYLVAGLGTVFAFLLALLFARRLTNPIRGMAQTASRLGRGQYDARVPKPSTAELGMLADSINTMAQQVQMRDAKLKEMSASVAHEIRNPLNTIKLLITLLEEELQEGSTSSQEQRLQTLHYEIGKLNRFLSEFLTYSRPITLARNMVDPATLAEGAVEMAQAEANDRKIEIVLEADEKLPSIRVDQQRLEQSLLNIILNAIHASRESGRVTVKTVRSTKDRGVDFIVEDDGAGIDEKDRHQLFEPFFTTKESGTGLGLSNAAKIIESHGGEIAVENIKGGGARFVIHLPGDTGLAKDL